MHGTSVEICSLWATWRGGRTARQRLLGAVELDFELARRGSGRANPGCRSRAGGRSGRRRSTGARGRRGCRRPGADGRGGPGRRREARPACRPRSRVARTFSRRQQRVLGLDLAQAEIVDEGRDPVEAVDRGEQAGAADERADAPLGAHQSIAHQQRQRVAHGIPVEAVLAGQLLLAREPGARRDSTPSAISASSRPASCR